MKDNGGDQASLGVANSAASLTVAVGGAGEGESAAWQGKGENPAM